MPLSYSRACPIMRRAIKLCLEAGGGGTLAKQRALWSYTIAGWSGFYVMLVELLSGRLIAPFFGSSIYVWGSVIFVFMLGLSIGYLLGGIYSRYNPSVPRLCGILIASALATLPTLFIGPWL